MATLYRGIGKVRAHGKARIAITLEARDEAEFVKRWHKPAYDYPFEWERGYKYCIEYQVEDFAAEVGFYVDILGITVDSISPSRAQFSSPDQELALAVSAVDPERPAPPPTNLRLQMFIQNLEGTVEELSKRGVVFERLPEPSTADADLLVSAFQTPNGMTIELWGFAKSQAPSQRRASLRSDKPEEAFDGLEEGDETDEQEEYPTTGIGVARYPLGIPTAHALVEDDDDLETDDDQDETTAEGRTSREDQLELEIGYQGDDQEDGQEDGQEDSSDSDSEDEDARLERFLEASRRPAGYTFDERVEPVTSPKPVKTPPAAHASRSNLMQRSNRSPAGMPVSRRLRKPQSRSDTQPSPPVIEPTYDDIGEEDQIP